MALNHLDLRNIRLQPSFLEMMGQVRYGNGDRLLLALGSLDRKKAAFLTRVFFANLRRYQARSYKRERHFIPDGILALKDRGVLRIKMAQELLLYRLLKEE